MISIQEFNENNIKKIELIGLWSIINAFVPIRSIINAFAPIKYFKKKGHLTRDLAENITTIETIYAVQSIEEIASIYCTKNAAFFKNCGKNAIDDINMFAWTSLTAYEAARKKTNTFNSENLPQLVKELREIFYKNDSTLVQIDKKLKQYGIIFLIMDKMDDAPIDGYTFWSINNPVIAFSHFRHNSIDNLAFTIIHEIGHIELHPKNNQEIKFLDSSKIKAADIEVAEIENQANSYALEHLVPTDNWADLIENFWPLSDIRLQEFSDKYRIHPAIVIAKARLEMDDESINTTIDQSLH